MWLGLLFGLSACLVWGLVFVIPEYLGSYTATEVVLGRYFTYGVASLAILLGTKCRLLKKYPLRIWGAAALFALISNLIYYLGLVVGLRLATPAITVLLVGMAPIMIAFYGNWQSRELSYRELMLPSLCIAMGMVLVNAVEIDWSFQETRLRDYCVGLLGALVALLAWTWYAVNNARFLKRTPEIASSDWSTIMGVTTLLWTFLIGGLLALQLPNEVHLAKFFTPSAEIAKYFMAVSLLGLLCSWMGCFLWSRASGYLPLAIMGPLLIFETIFGLIFVFLFHQRFPSWLELLGVTAMLGGILLTIHTFRKRQSPEQIP